MDYLRLAVAALLAYLIGSFSFGIFVSASKGRDIRAEGSKSSGATNVTRVLGWGSGLITFVGDFVKAALSIWIGSALAGQTGALTAAVFAVIGHNWPVYYRFKGGKGVVCSIAALLLLCPLEAGIAAVLTILIIWASRYVSLGSLSFLLISSLLLLALRGPGDYFWWSLILLALGLFQHRSNIGRLIAGKENKLNFKKTSS